MASSESNGTSEVTDYTVGELEVKHATLSVVKMRVEKIESILHTPMAAGEVVKLRREIEREMDIADAHLRRARVPDEGEEG